MEHLINFLGYMTFSGLEFLTIFLMICSIFSFNLRDYIKEITLGALLVTFVSYINVIFMINKFNLMPLFAVLVITYLLKKNFRVKKLWYAVAASVGGVLVYGVIQTAIALLSIKFGVIAESNINDSFSIEIYVAQSVSSVIGLVTSLFIRVISGGFGFEFRGGQYKIFSLINIIIIVTMLTVSTLFILNPNYINLALMTTTLVALCLTFLNLSWKRESFEFAREGVNK